MRVYLDYNATTPTFPEVWERVNGLRQEFLGNPSSVHEEGRKARRYVEEARRQVAELVGARPSEVIFTSGGTEANAAALWGLALELGGPAGVRFYLSAGEHPSVFSAAESLGRLGGKVVVLPLDREGLVKLENLTEIKPPAVVAVQLANHETGTLQNIAEISRQLAGPKIRFHCDAVQAVGKVAISFSELRVDTLALSGHKLGGFPGAGALVVKGGKPLPPLIPGEQERGSRGGTEPLVALCALGWACQLLEGRLGGWKEVAQLRDALEQSLLTRGLAERIFGQNALRVPNTTCLALPPPLTGPVAVAALDLKGIAVSSGPACSAGASQESRVVKAMGFTEQAARTLRVSLGLATTSQEVAFFLEALERLVSGRSARL